MSELFNAVGTISTGVLSQVGSITTAILGNDLLVLYIGLGVISFAVGLIFRMINKA